MSERDRRRAANELLQRCAATGATAVIVHPDTLTLTLVQQCLDTGISIPQDVAVVSHDDEATVMPVLNVRESTAARRLTHHRG